MSTKTTTTRRARGGKIYYPSAAGYPFSSAVRAGDFVFVSGQIAFLPDGSVSTGSIEAQTTIALESIKAILRKAGCTMADIVRCGCTLQDARDFDGFDKTYATYFPEDPPVRTTAVVQHVLDARVEIDCVAWRPLDAK
jgi:2-iminobutanoate/2-iminopropanoate deaminase